MPEATETQNETGFLNPTELLTQLGLLSGVRIAELGCGTGYMTFPAARLVGANGKVFAVDIRRSMLQQITTKAQEQGLFTVHPVWADLTVPGSTHIKADSVDATLLINVLFQIPDRKAAIEEARRITKPGGKLIVVDWNDKTTSIGPKAEQRISADEVKKLAGVPPFVLDKELSVGDYHFGFIFVKQEK